MAINIMEINKIIFVITTLQNKIVARQNNTWLQKAR